MKCPHCQRPVEYEAESCYSCDFSLEMARDRFGANPVRMRPIHDAADCLRVRETRQIRNVLDHLEVRFPQLLFGVYLGQLSESISMSELGFWLLNQARIEGSEFARPNDYGILLLFDVEHRQAGISLGYFCEMLLSERDCYHTLMANRSLLTNGEYGTAISRILRKIEKLLVKRSRKLKGLTREQMRSQLMKDPAVNSLALPGPFVPFDVEEGEESERRDYARF